MAAQPVIGSRGRHGAAAGRRYVRWLLLGLALVVLVTGRTPQAAPGGEPQVAVNESDGLYQVAATFGVAEAPAVAIAVLTDFERIPKFMPDMTTSSVLERSDAGTLVEQEATARFMMFSKKVHLRLRVSENNGTIRFRDECGRSFSRYEGLWRVTAREGRTDVEYQLGARPTFEVPAFVLKRLLKRDALEMIQRLQTEIARKAGAALRPE
jgi:ribosome-associated toxin RatA of RatAB toxin-antitoxin module